LESRVCGEGMGEIFGLKELIWKILETRELLRIAGGEDGEAKDIA
jgi:hypothetical protein